MTLEYQEAHLVRKIIAGLIDAALILGTLILALNEMAASVPFNIPVARINPTLLLIIGLGLYRFLSILLFNGTVGMKLVKIIFLNGEMEPLNFNEKLLAAFFILYRGVDYYERTKVV